MAWLSAEALFDDPVDEELRIWNRADLERSTSRVRVYTPRRQPPNPGNFNRQKTNCPQGHLYDEANTYRAPGKKARECKACRHDRRSE